MPELSERGLRFFPDIPCYDYTMLEALMMVGATDFYPHDDLLHDLPDVARISKDSHMGMRLVLNRIPATSPLRGSLPTHPIYMPQDRTYLDRWFSAYELDCGEPFRENMFNVLHRAWFERMEWKGDLSEINPDLAIQYMCPSILPDLVEKRARCHHRCVRMSGSRCDICNSVLDLSGRRPRFKRRDDGEEREDGGVAAER